MSMPACSARNCRKSEAAVRDRQQARRGRVIGTDIVAKAAPDGYTLLMMSNTHTTNETLLANKPYSLMHDSRPWRRSIRPTW